MLHIEIFWDQNQGSSIWGSRDIKPFRPRRMYYKMIGVVGDQVVMKRGEMQKNFPYSDRLPYFPVYKYYSKRES